MYKLLFILSLLVVFSCKKEEEKIDYDQLTHYQIFDLLDFDCQAASSFNYFTGTINGKPFCRYEGDLDSFQCYQAAGFVSTEPIISTGTTPQYAEAYFRFTPRGPQVAGTYEFYLLCRDTAFAGSSLGALIEKTFVEGNYLPLSTQFIDWSSNNYIPPTSAIHGAGIVFRVYYGLPHYNSGALFMSDMIVQERGRYIKCSKMQQTDTGYEIELDVNMEIPNAKSTYATKRLDMKGTFHFEIDL